MSHPWSHLWAESTILWAIHIVSNHRFSSWAGNVLNVRTASELRDLRSVNAGRPCTRLENGFCIRRWTEGVSIAFSYLLPSKKVQVKLNEFCTEFDQQDCDQRITLNRHRSTIVEARGRRVKID